MERDSNEDDPVSESSESCPASSSTDTSSSTQTITKTSPVVQIEPVAVTTGHEQEMPPRPLENAPIRVGHELSDPSSPSAESSYKRYKFNLSNHFITMPHVDGARERDAKFAHQDDGLKVVSRKEKKFGPSAIETISDKTKESVDNYLRSIRLARDTTGAVNSERGEYAEEEDDDEDRCDLSVMVPSSAGALSSLSMGSEEAEGRAESMRAPAAAAQTIVQPEGQRPPILAARHEGAERQQTATFAISSSSSNDLISRSAQATHDHLKATNDECYFVPQTSSNTYLDDGGSDDRLKGDLQQDIKKQQELATIGADCASNSVLIKFSSIMYATFLVVLGCILHVSELRQQSKNSSDHIYTIIVALVGISWLLFLQSDLQRYKRYASKYILIESIFNDQIKLQQGSKHHYQIDGSLVKGLPLGVDLATRSTSSSAASLVNDRTSMNTEVIFKKTAYKMYQQQRQQQRQKQPQNKYDAAPCVADHIATSELSPRQRNRCLTMIPAYKFLHGKMGANFYLKCGMAAFCFGSVIHEGLRFGQQLYFFATGNVHCRDSAALIAHLVTPLYSFYQLFMMFKYSNLVINRHKILARFGLMHIIGTCVTFWFRTILEEAFEDFVHKMDYFKAQNKPLSIDASMFTHNPSASLTDLLLNSLVSGETNGVASQVRTVNASLSQRETNASFAQSALLALMSSPISATITPQLVRHLPDSYACAQNTLLTTKSMNALPYLYPFTIEYNLLIAATFLSLYFNIGRVGGPHCAPASSRCSSQAAPLSSDGSCAGAAVAPMGQHQVKAQQQTHLGFKLQPASRWPSGASFSSVLAHSLDQQSAITSEHSSSALYRRAQFGAGSGSSIDATSHQQHLAGSGYGSEEKGPGEYKSNFVVNADCHAANKGLFCGFFVLLVTLVTIVIFFVTINKPSHVQLGIKINLIQEATLTGLILLVTLAAFRQIVRLNRNAHLKDKVTTDDVLMLIPLPFFFIHSLLSFRAETASLYSSTAAQAAQAGEQQASLSLMQNANNLLDSNHNSSASTNVASMPSQLNRLLLSLPSNQVPVAKVRENSTGQRNAQQQAPATKTQPATSASKVDYFKLLTVALNLGVMIEVLVQTNFIIDGLRRCSESRYLRFKKPGRELITFAILLNITYWIVATFETKSVEQYKTEIEYYGPLPYMFISHTTLPVMLFYRYHSSVCLAEIWNRAYKLPK